MEQLTVGNHNNSIENIPNNYAVQQQFEGVYDRLNQQFRDEDPESKLIRETRELLGNDADHFVDDQIKDLTSEIQFLVDGWLEEYERKVFDGKSLTELLHLNPIV